MLTLTNKEQYICINISICYEFYLIKIQLFIVIYNCDFNTVLIILEINIKIKRCFVSIFDNTLDYKNIHF